MYTRPNETVVFIGTTFDIYKIKQKQTYMFCGEFNCRICPVYKYEAMCILANFMYIYHFGELNINENKKTRKSINYK